MAEPSILEKGGNNRCRANKRPHFSIWSVSCPLLGNSAIGQWHLIIAHFEPIHETVQIKVMEMAYEEAGPEDVLRQEIRRQR